MNIIDIDKNIKKYILEIQTLQKSNDFTNIYDKIILALNEISNFDITSIYFILYTKYLYEIVGDVFIKYTKLSSIDKYKTNNIRNIDNLYDNLIKKYIKIYSLYNIKLLIYLRPILLILFAWYYQWNNSKENIETSGTYIYDVSKLLANLPFNKKNSDISTEIINFYNKNNINLYTCSYLYSSNDIYQNSIVLTFDSIYATNNKFNIKNITKYNNIK